MFPSWKGTWFIPVTTEYHINKRVKTNPIETDAEGFEADGPALG